MQRVIKITEQQAFDYLTSVKTQMDMGIEQRVAAPYFVMVKGYGEDWEEYNELNLDDLENENVLDAGYEDHQLWLNDTFINLELKGHM